MTTRESKLNANSRNELLIEHEFDAIRLCTKSHSATKSKLFTIACYEHTCDINPTVESIPLQLIPKSFRGRPDKLAKSSRKMTLAREAGPQGDVSDRQVCL